MLPLVNSPRVGVWGKRCKEQLMPEQTTQFRMRATPAVLMAICHCTDRLIAIRSARLFG
jgi:hypothetical protein